MSLISIKEPCSKNDKVENSCIGVDFGTTNSVCSIKIGNKVEFIKDQDENILIPSIVLFDNQKKVIGNTAIKNDKDLNSIKSIKRNFTENFDENLYLDNKGEKTAINVNCDCDEDHETGPMLLIAGIKFPKGYRIPSFINKQKVLKPGESMLLGDYLIAASGNTENGQISKYKLSIAGKKNGKTIFLFY